MKSYEIKTEIKTYEARLSVSVLVPVFLIMSLIIICTLNVSAAEMTVNGNIVTVSGAPDNSTLIIAFYKDGVLSDAELTKGSGTIAADISEKLKNADIIKAFLWDMETITPLSEATDIDTDKQEAFDRVYITANGTTLTAMLSDNTSAEAFVELLKQGDVTIEMSDYGNFEKVGPLGTSLPRNDEEITTEPGDVILYQGNSITIYYDTNTWDFTRLGKIENITGDELKSILGDGNVTVTFSLYN